MIEPAWTESVPSYDITLHVWPEPSDELIGRLVESLLEAASEVLPEGFDVDASGVRS